MKVSATVFSLVAIALHMPLALSAVLKSDAETADSRIKNVVVLVMENRSFDSILGRLQWDGIRSDIDGLTGNESNTLANGQVVPIQKGTNPAAGFDPNHGIVAVTEQIYGAGTVNAKGQQPTMAGFAQQGFVESKGNMDSVNQVMQAFGPDMFPVTYALAQEYTVIDNWFASVPGPTYPNRHFFHCATAAGYTANNGAFLGVPCRTIYENMADHGNSYKFYSPQLKSTPLLYRNLRNIYNWMRIKNMSTFFEDARAGSLPQYSFIDPDWLKNDNHPPNNLHAGEQYVKDIYEAIRAGPQWQNTVFVLTYDENGGFYDHVAPPTCVPRPDNINPDSNVGDFQFDRLGPRVPTIIISPYVSKGAVYHSDDTSRFFEHSSIPATLKKLFNLPNFLTPRDAAALTFDDVISLSEPRTDCIQTLPTV